MAETSVGTLGDTEIKKLCEEGFLIEEDFEPKGIKQACYELRCGNIYYQVPENKRFVVDDKSYLLLKAKQTLVVITKESLRLPPDILGRILTKGALFSIGILPVNTYADPGFSGQLGIVLHNLSNSYIRIKCGEPIAKIEFSRLLHPVDSPMMGNTAIKPRCGLSAPI